jgi:hypothetical protein
VWWSQPGIKPLHRRFVHILGLSPKILRPDHLIPTIADRCGVTDPRVIQNAMQWMRAQPDNSGGNRQAMAGAALWVASRMHGLLLSQTHILQHTQISDQTLRKYIKKFQSSMRICGMWRNGGKSNSEISLLRKNFPKKSVSPSGKLIRFQVIPRYVTEKKSSFAPTGGDPIYSADFIKKESDCVIG